MTYGFYSVPWWASGMTYRTCEIPCEGGEGCPSTHICMQSHPGPLKSHCILRSSLPHWNERGPHDP